MMFGRSVGHSAATPTLDASMTAEPPPRNAHHATPLMVPLGRGTCRGFVLHEGESGPVPGARAAREVVDAPIAVSDGQPSRGIAADAGGTHEDDAVVSEH